MYHMNSTVCNAGSGWNCGTSVVDDKSYVLITQRADYGFQNTFLAGSAGDTSAATWSLVSAPTGFNTPLISSAFWKASDENGPAYTAPAGGGGGIGGWFLAGTNNGSVGAAVANGTGVAAGLTLTTTATAAGATVGNWQSSFTPAVAGVYVWKLTAGTTSYTWTVNAYATQVALDAGLGVDNAISAAKTTSFLNSGEASSATEDAKVVASKTIGADAVATIVVTPKNAAGTTLSNVTFPITATISGPGSLRVADSVANATASPAGRAVTGQTGHYYIGVFSDGTAGPATITISSGSTVLSTETVVFYGDVASYSATVKKNVIPMGVETAAVVAVVAKDKDGNVVPSQTVTVKASDSAVVADVTNAVTSSASQAADGTASIGVTGIATKFGKVTLTISNAAATISTTAVVTLSSTTAKTVTLAFDKAEYSAGEKVTLKATAVDANGLPVASMDPIGGLTANTPLFGFPETWTSTTTDGAVSYSFYAPLVPGPITLTGTDSNAAAITASATVISDGVAQAAADAAAEAIDAANAATDAANAAAEAADAATAAAQDAADAVAALSVQVSEQIAELKAQNDALRKQLIALTNLIIKIQKKVKA
jgi:hypothetical protein